MLCFQVLSQREIIRELTGEQPSKMLIIERGCLGARRAVQEEAVDMADALYVALRSRIASMCEVLDADVKAAKSSDRLLPEEWLAQVRVSLKSFKTKQAATTVALLVIEPLGSTICGSHASKVSGIFGRCPIKRRPKWFNI
jgi:hypothetical protein